MKKPIFANFYRWFSAHCWSENFYFFTIFIFIPDKHRSTIKKIQFSKNEIQEISPWDGYLYVFLFTFCVGVVLFRYRRFFLGFSRSSCSADFSRSLGIFFSKIGLVYPDEIEFRKKYKMELSLSQATTHWSLTKIFWSIDVDVLKYTKSF